MRFPSLILVLSLAVPVHLVDAADADLARLVNFATRAVGPTLSGLGNPHLFRPPQDRFSYPQRREALISTAHPDFRAELRRGPTEARTFPGRGVAA